MDNQLNNQNPVKPTPINSTPVVPEAELLPPPTKPQIPKTSAVPEAEVPLSQPEKPVAITETPIIPETPVSNPVPQTEFPSQPEVETTPSPSEYQNEYQGVLDQYAATQETTTPPVPENKPQPAVTLADLGITEKPPQNNIFKFVFISSLIIFILVTAILALVYFNSQKRSVSTPIPAEATPTQAATGTCFLNEKFYQVGESFVATDGCNTCTCVSKDNINCSDNKCLSSESATKSATTTPTKTGGTTSTSSAATK